MDQGFVVAWGSHLDSRHGTTGRREAPISLTKSLLQQPKSVVDRDTFQHAEPAASGTRPLLACQRDMAVRSKSL